MLLFHAHQEFGVGLRLSQAVDEEVHGVGAVHFVEHAAEEADAAVLFGVHEHFFAAGAAAGDVDGRPNAAVDEAAIENDFLIAGAFEFLEDHFVHFAAGIDQRGGDDRERAAVFDAAGGAEKALWALHGVGVDAAGEDFAGVGALGVPGAGQAGDGIEEDHDVAAVFDHSLGFFDDHFAHLHVAGGGFVERGADDLAVGAFDLPLHVGDFFGPLVDEQHDHVGVGVVRENGLGHFLEQDGFAGAGWADDETTLAEADGDEHVDDAHFDLVAGRFHDDSTLRVNGREIVEEDFAREQVRIVAVDRFDAEQREVAFVFFGWADCAGHGVAVAEAEAADLAWRDVDVVRAAQVVIVGAAKEAEAIGQDFERALAVHQAFELHPLLEDAEDEVLLLEAADFGNVFGFGRLNELGDAHSLQLGDVDVAVAGIVLGDGGTDAADALGSFIELFGERQRFFAIELGEELAIDLRVAISVCRPHAAMHGARAIVPRIAVRLIGHELCAPWKRRAGTRETRRRGGDLRKKMDSEGKRERPAVRCLSGAYYVMRVPAMGRRKFGDS